MYKCYRLNSQQLFNSSNSFLFLHYFFYHFRRSSIGTFIRSHPSSDSSATSSQSNKPQKPQAPKLDYRSMVSIDDMPALFVSFDSKYLKIYLFFFLQLLSVFTLFLLLDFLSFFSRSIILFTEKFFKRMSENFFLINFLFEDP